MEAIRTAIAGIIKDHKAGLLAHKLGDLNISTVYKWSEMSTEMDKHSEIPLRRAIQLTLVTGDTRLISAIAEAAGGVFIPGHQLISGKHADEKMALKVLKESAALIKDYISAMEAGEMTIPAYMGLTREAMKLHLAVAAIVESARLKVGV